MPLGELIGQLADDFGNRSGLRVQTDVDPLPASLPARQQAELLRVIQEALTNVGKHADATMVRVRAAVDDEDVVVNVVDNGRGFDPEAGPTEGLGLRGMEERARLMGGELTVASKPSDGTTVSLRVPIEGPPGTEDEMLLPGLAPVSPPIPMGTPPQPPTADDARSASPPTGPPPSGIAPSTPTPGGTAASPAARAPRP
jgi:anti-sigma regulatory factor (Ser/Thr protein kinase)